MALKISTLARNAMLDALAAQVDAGTGAVIEIRTGSPPANTTDADTGTLLATCLMSTTAFVAADTGTIEENPITADTSGDATGTPGHFRVKTQAGGTVVLQGSAGVSAGDLSFSAGISLGGTVTVTNFAITAGNA
jgi:hypothetical protein